MIKDKEIKIIQEFRIINKELNLNFLKLTKKNKYRRKVKK